MSTEEILDQYMRELSQRFRPLSMHGQPERYADDDIMIHVGQIPDDEEYFSFRFQAAKLSSEYHSRHGIHITPITGSAPEHSTGNN